MLFVTSQGAYFKTACTKSKRWTLLISDEFRDSSPTKAKRTQYRNAVIFLGVFKAMLSCQTSSLFMAQKLQENNVMFTNFIFLGRLNGAFISFKLYKNPLKNNEAAYGSLLGTAPSMVQI